MHSAMLVKLQPVPLGQQIESCHSEGKPRLKVGPDTMSHMLEVTNSVQHRKHSLNHHTSVPLTSLAHQQICGVALLAGEQRVGQHDHLLLVLGNHRVEGGVMNIGSSTVPIYNQTPLVQQHAQLASYDPFVIGKAFAPYLVRCSLIPPRVKQLYSICVDYSHQGRLSHKASRPLLMSSKQSKQTGTFRQGRKQSEVVTFDPTIESSVAYALDREQHSQRYHLAWVQTGLAVFGHVMHGIIYSAKQFRDKIRGRHRVLLELWSRKHQLQRTLCFCQLQTSTIR